MSCQVQNGAVPPLPGLKLSLSQWRTPPQLPLRALGVAAPSPQREVRGQGEATASPSKRQLTPRCLAGLTSVTKILTFKRTRQLGYRTPGSRLI